MFGGKGDEFCSGCVLLEVSVGFPEYACKHVGLSSEDKSDQ